MQIVVLKETSADEIRVALVPESVKKLVASGNKVFVENGAGVLAGAYDADYEQAGAVVSSDREDMAGKADVLLALGHPADEILPKLKKAAIVIALLRPLDEPDKLRPFMELGLTAISLEMIPR